MSIRELHSEDDVTPNGSGSMDVSELDGFDGSFSRSVSADSERGDAGGGGGGGARKRMRVMERSNSFGRCDETMLQSVHLVYCMCESANACMCSISRVCVSASVATCMGA